MEQNDGIVLIRTGDVLSLEAVNDEKSETAEKSVHHPGDWREHRIWRAPRRRVPA